LWGYDGDLTGIPHFLSILKLIQLLSQTRNAAQDAIACVQTGWLCLGQESLASNPSGDFPLGMLCYW
jgi:catabolite regulation protein CreA